MIESFEQCHHLARGGEILTPLPRTFNVHHLALKMCILQSKSRQHALGVWHSYTVDQDISCRVVADRDHHGSQITICDTSNMRRKS